MSRWIPFFILPVLLSAPNPCAAGTSGIDLAWGTCAMTGGSGDQYFACDTNYPLAPYRLAMVFRSPSSIPDFAGVSMTLNICTSLSAGLPDWWKLGPGQCRDGAFTFPAATSGLGSTCTDIWIGHETGGGFVAQPVSPSRIRIVMDFAAADTAQVTAGVRYVGGVATLDRQSTVPGGSSVCAGCLEGVSLYLQGVELFGFSPSEDYMLSYQDTRQFVLWQGGDTYGPFCVPDPTRNATWGAIKSMYR
ncbi:MAG: hypothetical protein ACHQ52_13930 [Candidatus Eisenbacteria bacterium]